MRRVKSTDTGPELALRRALWRRGLRYRLHARNLPGKPDLTFPRHRVAVFVDGDFWHGRQWQARGLPSLTSQFKETQAAYWVGKIQRNVERDARVNEELASLGWRVVRFWESSVREDLEGCVEEVLRQLGKEN